MIIDFHCHVEYETLEDRWTAERFVSEMDRAGIDKAVILGADQVDPGTRPPWSAMAGGPTLAKNWLEVPSAMPVAANFDDEAVADFCAQFPDRLVGLASIHPERYRPDLKIERAVTKLGLRGVKIYPHAGFYPNDRRLDRVYDTCIKLDVPVVFHTGIEALRWQWLKYNNPVFVDDVATNFPELKIVMSHGGYPWCEEFLVVVYSNPNIYVDLTFMDYIEKTFHVEGLVEQTVKRLVRLIGAERLLWGSEGPAMFLPLFGKHDSSYCAQSRDYLVNRFDFLSDEQKQAILGGNAAKLLKL